MKTINKNKQQEILYHIKWLLSKSHLIAHALSAKFDEFDYQAHIEIAAMLFIINGKLSLPRDIMRKFVIEAVWALKKEKIDSPSWGQLSKKILSLINDYDRQITKEYLILFPLLIDKTGDIKDIKILDVNFKISSWQKVKKLHGWEEFTEKFKLIENKNKDELIRILTTKFIPLFAKVSAMDFWDAFEKGKYRFEILRSLINLMTEFAVFHGNFIGSSINKPLGRCLPPEVCGIFDKEGNFKEIAFLYESHNFLSIKSPNANVLPYVVKWHSRIKRLRKELRDIVMSSLILYGQAMDTTNWQVSFLTLWQILELLALRNIAEKNITMSDVAKRIEKLVSNEDPWKDVLKILTESRHSLVHKGEFSEKGYLYVNFIKIFSENAIGGFISLAEKFQSIEEINAYYEFLTIGNDDLNERKQRLRAQQNAINKLLKDRK